MHAALMLALKTQVFFTTLPAGATASLRLAGRIIGRTFEAAPRYDVLGEDGRIWRNLREADLEIAILVSMTGAETRTAA